MTIDLTTWKVPLFMPKLAPKIRAISGPEIMYLWKREKDRRERERQIEREGEVMKKVARKRSAQKVGSYICSTGVEGASAANLYMSQSGSDPLCVCVCVCKGGVGGFCFMERRESIPSSKYMFLLTKQDKPIDKNCVSF